MFVGQFELKAFLSSWKNYHKKTILQGYDLSSTNARAKVPLWKDLE